MYFLEGLLITSNKDINIYCYNQQFTMSATRKELVSNRDSSFVNKKRATENYGNTVTIISDKNDLSGRGNEQ